MSAPARSRTGHEYMQFVAEHPGWEITPYDSPLTADYGSFGSLADLFRQIGHDERVHNDDSLGRMREARVR
jgi:ubiquinol oxidase